MTKKEKVTTAIGDLNDIIARCRYFIHESSVILKGIKEDFTEISFPIAHYKIIELVKDEFKIDFVIKSRKREIISARFACAYLLKKFTGLTLIEIAEYIGSKDHTSVIHAIKACTNWMATDIDYRMKIKKLENELWKYHNELYGNNLQKV
jgi:chromosomal replication initiator protein